MPPGHPEGYQEAFATLYRDIADRIHAHLGGWEAPAHTALVPTVEDGAKGVRFISAAVESSKNDAAWTSLALDL